MVRDITSKQIERANLVFRGRMSCTPFLNHPAFKYSFSLTGYKDFTYGAVTGPAISISNLFHEMAHSIEFILSGDDPKHRARGGRYHFGTNQIENDGRLYEQVQTNQITLRECRTFAIQIKLMHSVGFRMNLFQFARESARLTTWLPDWYLVEGDNEIERVAWCNAFILQHYENLKLADLYEAFATWLDEIHSLKNEFYSEIKSPIAV